MLAAVPGAANDEVSIFPLGPTPCAARAASCEAKSAVPLAPVKIFCVGLKLEGPAVCRML